MTIQYRELFNQVGTYITVADIQDENTSEPTGTADSHHTFSFNTTDNNISGCSTSGGTQITLPEGTYVVTAHTDYPKDSVNSYGGIRLRDVTNDVTLARSVLKYQENVTTSGAGTAMDGVFELTGTAVVEAQWGRSNGTIIGFTADITGEDECFFTMTITKIG